ncbi:hypothetical protein [Psychrobacillus sp. FSL K6-1464]|uniref:hypothetical protein n=1 Tax=Psychrobacillus sp. FSL K6-1464 TaxID=2921545 RepID=UPI0030F9B47B
MNEKVKNRLMLVEYNIKLMEDYLKHFKEYLDNLQSKSRSEYLQQQNLHDDLGNLSLQLQFMGIFNKNNIFFPQLHYSSFLVTCYSLIESELNEFCLIAEEELKLRKKVSSLDGSGILRSQKYFEKIVKININKTKWDELHNLRRLRNKIVHLGPDFDKKLLEYDEKELKKYIEKHNLIKEIKYKTLIIDYSFCIYLLDFLSKFFFEIANDTSGIIQRA